MVTYLETKMDSSTQPKWLSPRARGNRVILNYFFLRLAYAWRTPHVAPHLRHAWRRWLSALQLGVLKLAGGVAECGG